MRSRRAPDGNTLEARDNSGTVDLYINGQKVNSIPNTYGYSEGVIGIYASSGVQVAFTRHADPTQNARMKQCPRCKQTYSDDTLNFCLNDGELLTMLQPTPGGYIEDSRRRWCSNRGPRHGPDHTGSSSRPRSPPAQWQHKPTDAAAGQFGAFPMQVAPNQTLAVVSLCLGAASMTIGWCCSLGVILGPAAIITGLIAKSQIKKDPSKYTGSGLATAGSSPARYLSVSIF